MDFDNSENWFSVSIRPSLWWRIKALFKQPDIVFCASDKSFMMNGFLGETYLAAGGVPVFMRHRIQAGQRAAAPAAPDVNGKGG